MLVMHADSFSAPGTYYSNLRVGWWLQLLLLGPNQYFGEKALLGNYTYRASAVAKGRVTVLRASREDFTMVCNLNAQHGSPLLG